MKKRILSFLLTVSTALFVTACGAADSGVNEKGKTQLSGINDMREGIRAKLNEEDASGTVPVSDGLSDQLSACQVSIDGVIYEFPMKYSEFEELGWEFSGDDTQLLEAGYWDMPADLWYKEGYGAYVVLANPFAKMMPYSDSMVSGIILMDAFLSDCDWEIILPGGIRYGVSTVEDIRAAYGDPTYGNEQQGTYTLNYTYEGIGDSEVILSVYGDDKTLKYIDIKNIVRVEQPEIDQELRILD